MKFRKFINISTKNIFFILTTVILLGAAQGADISISANVDRSSAAPGEEFIYNVKISSESNSSLPEPDLPSLYDFEIISGPNNSQSVQIINGKMSAENNYSVHLSVMKPGNYIIAPASIKVKGKTYRSNTCSINIIKSTSKNLPSGFKNENIPAPRTSNAKIREQIQGKLFLRTEISNNKPYVGEPIVVSYTLYAMKGLPLHSWNPNFQAQQFKGFLKEELYNAKRLSLSEVNIDGNIYQTALIKKIILVPTKTGKISPDPLSVDIGLKVQRSSRRRRDFFGDSFFNRNTETVTVPSSIVELNVQQLPSPRPDDFNGTVGDYKLRVSTDLKKASTDDLVTLTLNLSGKGAIECALNPVLPLMDDFEIYDTKAKSKKQISGESLGGSKIFEYILRPKKSGDLEIPSITYSIFNPAEKKYITLKTKKININISPGTATAPLIITGSVPLSSGEKLILINADINYIKNSTSFECESHKVLIKSEWFLWLQALPLIFLLLSFFISQRRDTLESNVSMARRLRARGAAGKRLKAASKALALNNSDKFHAEISSALRGFFGDKLNRGAHGLTIDELMDNLEERDISPETGKDLREFLENADAARYSPSSHSMEEMKKCLAKAEKIIWEFNKKL
jgi:oxygen tolerance protein BatD